MASTSGLENKQLFGSGSGEARDWLLQELKVSLKKKDWNKIVNFIVKEHHEALTVPLNKRNENLLMHAILSGQSLSIVRQLVQLMSDDDLTRANSLGNTALHIAVIEGETDSVRLLVDKSPISLNIKNNGSCLPVHLAFLYHNPVSIDILLGKMEQLLEKVDEGIGNSDLEAGNHQPPSELMRLVEEGDWEKVMNFVRQHPAESETNQDFSVIQELVQLMSKEALALTDILGNTCLHIAAFNGRINVAQLLLKKNPDLLYVKNDLSFLPVHMASAKHLKMMTTILLKEMTEGSSLLQGIGGTLMLDSAVHFQLYDLAVYILQTHPEVCGTITKYYNPLSVLCGDPFAFPSGKKLSTWRQSIVSQCIPETYHDCYTFPIVKSYFSNQTGNQQLLHTCSLPHVVFLSAVFGRIRDALFHMLIRFLGMSKMVKSLVRIKINQRYSMMLLKECCELFMSFPEKEKRYIFADPIAVAIKNGLVEIVDEILKSYPNVFFCDDSNGDSPLKLSIAYRQGKVFKILRQHQEERLGYDIGNWLDNDSRTTLLHLVAQKPTPNYIDSSSNTVIHMQRELQWFQAVEDMVRPFHKTPKNKGKTPWDVFVEEHRELEQNEKNWIISIATSSSVVASLIATVAFAGAITVPGGNNSQGLPNFNGGIIFNVFMYSDSLAFAAALTTVLTFITIFTSQSTPMEFMHALPRRVLIGLTSLAISVMLLMIAFGSSMFLVVGSNRSSLVPIILIGILPILLYISLQHRSVVSMIKSTYQTLHDIDH